MLGRILVMNFDISDRVRRVEKWRDWTGVIAEIDANALKCRVRWGPHPEHPDKITWINFRAIEKA